VISTLGFLESVFYIWQKNWRKSKITPVNTCMADMFQIQPVNR